MKKILLLVLALCMLLAVYTVTAAAAEDDYDAYYYVNGADGDDNNDGTTPYRAVKTISEAFRYAAKHGDNEVIAIVITDAYKLSGGINTGIPHENTIVVTTNDGITDYGALGAKIIMGKSCRFNLPGPTVFENLTFDFTSSITFIGNYYPQVFGKNLQFNKLTEEGNGIYVYGGYRQPLDTVTPIDRDGDLTFESGSYYLVVAGSRDLGTKEDGKKSGHIKFQNTNYLTINGGDFKIIYGGTHAAHAALNVDITVNGGTIETLSASGDLTRRAYGDAVVRLNGGEIGEFKLNNIVRAGNVFFNGTKIGKASVSYASTEIEEYAAKANQKKIASYDANFYSAEEIALLTEGYDKVVNATYVYAKAGAKGSGASEKDAADFATALVSAASKNATVKVIGTLTLENFTAENTGAVTVTGVDEKAKLVLNGTCTFVDTTFTAITVDGNAEIVSKGGTLTFAKDVKLAYKPNLSGSAYLATGAFGSISGFDTLTVDGATVDSVIVSGTKDATVSITSGTVQSLVFRNMSGETNLQYLGGKIASTAVEGNNASGIFTAANGVSAESLGAAASLFAKVAERVVFAMDGATGNGVSPATPASFADAYAALTNGGTLVVIGEVKSTAAFYQAPENTGKITITSLWDGVDYRVTNGARIVLPRSFYFRGNTDVDHVTIISQGNNAAFFCFYHDVTFGRDIIGGYEGSSTTYPCIVTGAKGNIANVSGTVTVNGGDWQRLRLGNSGENPTNVTTNVIVNGGNFHGYVYMVSTSHKTHSGKGNLTINGGNFYSGILGAYYSNAATQFDGDLTLTINGGAVYNVIEANNDANGVITGSFTLVLQGGDFSHLTDIKGVEKDGFVCKLQVSESINIDATLTGTYAYQNELRQGPDPFLFYHDGCYYYTSTAGSVVRLYKAANFGDFQHGISEVIYDPEDNTEWGKNLWAPEIQYYSAEEVGEKYAGWYLYVGGSKTDEDTTVAGGQRLYVLKCLTDDLQGAWGHPETGEVNVPMRVSFPGTNYNTTQTTADASVMRIGGKPYLLFFTTYRAAESETGKPYQAIVIADVENPWTFPNASEICHPEYEWEKVGGGTMQVVEGPFGLQAPDGTTYIVYSGSGYWTTAYCLASLRYLGGDPLVKASWEKSPTPFFSKSDSINGCGHASAFTSPDGKMWLCYHAYIGKDATGSRYSFVEPLTADKNGIKVGNGSGNPAPMDTVWTVNVNPQPIREKMVGFSVIETVKSTATVVKLTIGKSEGYVNGTAKALDAAPVIRNSRTMLPVRFVAENLGAVVGWDGATSTVTVETPAKRIEIVIGKTVAKVNGVEIALDSPAFIENSRTYLPVRFIAENLGATVAWDGATSTATLTK